ncbi:NAD(P)/FAD-dependent oxidoreductase [Nostoc sp. UIC 10607]|uniref:NAD(P)/FAD-dependent oxidoreductase n=1 Tax=Nostoc sp. UIC 10607 TaxID=3045935 RepID=UPI0039A1416E
MNSKHFDVTIVGSGPAGLFLAREILLNSPNKKVALIDSGRSIVKRHCPLVEKGNCTQCNTCHAVQGVGGAGMFSDGKLSLFPAGSGLVKITGSESTVKSINEYVVNAFLESVYHDKATTSKAFESNTSCVAQLAIDNQMNFKCYDVHHVGTEGIQEYCIELEKQLINLGVTLMTQTQFLDIEKFENIFVSTVKDGRGQTLRISSDYVVMATGKSSGLILRKICQKLNVGFDFNAIELGVRVETSRSAIKALSESHLDAKLKMETLDDAEVRTFCLCDGGYLVSCFYDDYLENNQKICTISGYSFNSKKSNNSNFSILVRKNFPQNIDPISMQLGIIQAVNKASGHGGTVVQRYGDFVSRRPTSLEALRANSIQSTLIDATPTNLRWLLPEYVCSAAEEFLDKLSCICPEIGSDDTLLHAPVWELCWDRMIVGPNLTTTVPGFYIVGDAMGWARGIVQAATTGVIVARDILSCSSEKPIRKPVSFAR